LRGTARSRAGFIELGDIIVKINSDDITNEADLFRALETKKPGDTVKITILRTDMQTEEQTKLVLSLKLQVQLALIVATLA
jgi:S1-C subfamily serine protease